MKISARSLHQRGALALLLTFAVLSCASGASADVLSVRQAGGVTFPDRTLVLSVPRAVSLTLGRVHISENGAPIKAFTVNSLSQANPGDLGVILAIDSDPSMAGAPLVHAMAAARALAAQRTGNEELGLVYGDGTTIPLTSNPQLIRNALSHPPRIGHAINLLQATKTAIEQSASAKIADAAVIFITDDIDRDPIYSPQAVAAYARSAHVRIFAVGIRDAAFAHPNRQDLPASSMRVLAESAGGTYTEAAPAQLASIFTSIAAQLKSQYVVHYRSNQVPGRAVSFSVRVDGIPGGYSGTYPSAPAQGVTHPRPGPRHPPQSFWASSLALVAAALVCAALIGLAVAVLLSHYVRGGALRRRVAAFVSETESEPVFRPTTGPGEARGALTRGNWWAAFEEKVEIGAMSQTPTQLVYLALGGSLLLAIVLQLLTGLLPLAILSIFLPPVAVRALVDRAVQRQRLLFMDQFPGLIHEVAGAMRTGRSLVEALGAVSANADEPSRREYESAVADERAGRNIEDALRPIGERMAIEEIEQVAIVASLHRRTGANITEVLDHVADTARQRSEIKRELRSLTAQARLSRNILVALPPFVVIALTLIGGDFEKPLFNTVPGVILLIVCTAMVATGAKIMKAIVDIEE